mgnify:CR=1 FL=1|tara:strand:- start:1253 stop:1708 length:456 start_codon:yes stop_codon:yes gene_type:complete
MSNISISHCGLCISNLEKSLEFYCDGLGFEQGVRLDIGNEFQRALEVEGNVSLTSFFISKDGFNIELLHYASPEVHGEPSKSRNQLGLTHISLNVDDVDAVGAKLVELGGTRLEGTMTEVKNADGSILKLGFFTDPDGTRIELMANATLIA